MIYIYSDVYFYNNLLYITLICRIIISFDRIIVPFHFTIIDEDPYRYKYRYMYFFISNFI